MERLGLILVLLLSLLAGNAHAGPLPPACAADGSHALTYSTATSSYACTAVTASGGSGIAIGTTGVTGGTSTRVLFDNAGVAGEYAVSGTGNVCLTTNCALTTPNLGTPSALTLTNATGLPLAGLVTIGSNTVIGNFGATTAAATANAMPSCADSGGNHLNYTLGTGVSCGTSSSGGGGGTVTLGTTAAINNPQISGDATSGLNTTAASTVGMAVGGINYVVIGTHTTTGIPQVAINGAINYTQNTDPVSMPHFRKCMTNVNTGNTAGANGGRCRILGMGASVDYGYGSQGGGTDVKTFAWLNQLSRYLALAYNVPSDFNGFYGDSDNAQLNTTANADPRWTSLTGWGGSSGNLTLGGQFFASSANAVTANYKPDKPWTKANILYAKYSGGGSFNFAVDGGSATTVSTNAAFAIATSVITAPACTTGAPVCNHTFNITCQSGNCSTANVFAIGAEFYDETHPGISVMAAGAYGETTGTIIAANSNSSAYTGTTVLATVAPDVVIFGADAVLNDVAASTAIATVKSNLHTLFTAVTAVSDLVCVTSQHATTPYADATTLPYMQAFIAQCKADGAVIADNWSAQASYSPFTITSGGLNWSFDTAHLTRQGYNDQAANVAWTLLQAVHPMNGMRPAMELWSKSTDVNNILATGGATGLNPVIAAQGTDTNVGMGIVAQGTGTISIGTASSPVAGYALNVNGLVSVGNGTKFAVASGCGVVGSLTGNATTGTFTAGQTGCVPVLTLPTAPNGWWCHAWDITTNTDTLKQTARSVSSCTLSGTVVNADVILFHAEPY